MNETKENGSESNEIPNWLQRSRDKRLAEEVQTTKDHKPTAEEIESFFADKKAESEKGNQRIYIHKVGEINGIPITGITFSMQSFTVSGREDNVFGQSQSMSHPSREVTTYYYGTLVIPPIGGGFNSDNEVASFVDYCIKNNLSAINNNQTPTYNKFKEYEESQKNKKIK